MAASDSFVGEGLNDSPYKEALARAERAEAERDALRRDAERYRWLFHHSDSPLARANKVWRIWDGRNATWDDAIDAALAAKGEGK